MEKCKRLYAVWGNMKQRCHNPSQEGFRNYGGRGISVCEEWFNDYQSFQKWAYANGYDPNAPRNACTIDRIDNDGDYAPENCRWATMKEQAQNKRLGDLGRKTKHGDRMITCDGETHSIQGWADKLGVSIFTLFTRRRRGMTDEEMIKMPIGKLVGKNKQQQNVILNGKTPYRNKSRKKKKPRKSVS